MRNCNVLNSCTFLDVFVQGHEKESETEEKKQQKMLKGVFISKA